jgi:acyl dehydratase
VTPAAPPDTITPAIVGATVGPVTCEIDARWLMAYAAALHERDPRYFDTLATHGPRAHPLFAVCYEWPAAVALRELTIPPALRSRGVHATHHLVIHRALRAGDRLHTVGRVTAVEARRSGTLIVCRFETSDVAGEPVTTTDYGSVYRGVALVDAGASTGTGRPGAIETTGPAAGPPATRWTQGVQVAADAAWVYTECARIWNPIHTDVAVARAAGLPAPILHGTATLALAVSRVVACDLDGDAAAVAEVSARFTGMVEMPSMLTVRGGQRRRDRIGFDVLNEAGSAVLTAGHLRSRTEISPVEPRGLE